MSWIVMVRNGTSSAALLNVWLTTHDGLLWSLGEPEDALRFDREVKARNVARDLRALGVWDEVFVRVAPPPGA